MMIPARSHSARVLIVMENRIVCDVVSECVRELGHHPEIVGSRPFMTAFVRFKPDVVVLDIERQHDDGFELLQWMADVDYTGSVIAVSRSALYLKMIQAIADATGRMKLRPMAWPFERRQLTTLLAA